MIAGLYAVTRETDDTPKLLAQIEAALRGGATAVQYRDKSNDVARQHEQASELSALCRSYAVPLIVNDHLRLADLVGADGLHIGQDDGSLREARLILGHDVMIGVSCYQSLDRALVAQAAGADYVAFGRFFSSATKPDAHQAPVSLLVAASSRIHRPIVAIGGITPENASVLLDAGADAVAVIGALFDAADTESVARHLTDLFVEETED